SPYDSVVSWGGDAFGAPTDGNYCGPGSDVGVATGCGATNPAAAAFIAPASGFLTGLGVQRGAPPLPGNTETYTVFNVTAGRDAAGLNVSLSGSAGDIKKISSTCTGDCFVFAGDLIAVRFNNTGAGLTAGFRNITVSLDRIGQIDTSRSDVAIPSITRTGNF